MVSNNTTPNASDEASLTDSSMESATLPTANLFNDDRALGVSFNESPVREEDSDSGRLENNITQHTPNQPTATASTRRLMETPTLQETPADVRLVLEMGNMSVSTMNISSEATFETTIIASPDGKRQRINSPAMQPPPNIPKINRQLIKPHAKDVLLKGVGGKASTIKWREDPLDREENATRRRRNVTFKEWVGRECFLDKGFVIERMRSLLTDPQIGKPFFNEKQIKDLIDEFEDTSPDDSQRLLESLRKFYKNHSIAGGGTRPKEHQHAVEMALLASIWGIDDDRQSVLFLRNDIGCSADFAKKLVKMKADGVLKVDRKSRKDAIKTVVFDYIDAFCHDDHCTRADTSNAGVGASYRNHVKIFDVNGTVKKDKNGKVVRHPRRVWPCCTIEEKYDLFKQTTYYTAMKADILENIPEKDPKIVAAKEMLRPKLRSFLRHLGQEPNKPLKSENLELFLENECAGRYKTTKYTLHHELVKMAFETAFDRSVDNITQEELDCHQKEPIGMKMFSALLCRCVSNPTTKSCVDVIFTQQQAYQTSLATAMRFKKEIREKFEACPCKHCNTLRDKNRDQDDGPKLFLDYFTKSYYQLQEQSLCDRVPIKAFGNVLDKNPRMIPLQCMKCSETGAPACPDCGIDNNFDFPLQCDILRKCDIRIETLEYKKAVRSGTDSSGKQRTQLELTPVVYPFYEVVRKLKEIVEGKGKVHFVLTQWTNRAIENRSLFTDKNILGLFADYGATLNLFPIYKMNCHENAHATDLVIIAHANPRLVTVMANGKEVQHFIRDTIAMHGFSDTISKGKKTDAYGFRRVLEEFIIVLEKHYFHQKEIELDRVEIFSDNCSSQFKCRHAFWHEGTLAEGVTPRRFLIKQKLKAKKQNGNTSHPKAAYMSLRPETIEGMGEFATMDEFQRKFEQELPTGWREDLGFEVRHLYSEAMQGKGCHDGDAAVVKRVLHWAEKSKMRSPDAAGVLVTMTEIMGAKKGLKNVRPEIAEWERSMDKRLLNIRPNTITHRLFLGLLEDKTKLEMLRNAGFEHCHAIDRTTPPLTTPNPVPNCKEFREVAFDAPNYTSEDQIVKSSTLACACDECAKEFNSPRCNFGGNRLVSEFVMKPATLATAARVPRPRRNVTVLRTAETDAALQKIIDFSRGRLLVRKIKEDTKNLTKDHLANLAKEHAEKQGISLPKTPSKGKNKIYWIVYVHNFLFPNDKQLDIDSLLGTQNEVDIDSVHESEEEEEGLEMDNVSILSFGSDADEPPSTQSEGRKRDRNDMDVCNATGEGSNTAGSCDPKQDYQHLDIGLVGFETCGRKDLENLNAAINFLSASQFLFVPMSALALQTEGSSLLAELARLLTQLNVLSGPLSMSLQLFKRLFDAKFVGSDALPSPIRIVHCLLDFFGKCRTDDGPQLADVVDVSVSESAVGYCINQILESDRLFKNHPLFFVLNVQRDKQKETSDTAETPVILVAHLGGKQYRLRATINKELGRYVAYVKRASDDQGWHWIRCDGALCQRVEEKEVQRRGETSHALLYELDCRRVEAAVTKAFVNGIEHSDELHEKVIYSNDFLQQQLDPRNLSVPSLQLQLEARGETLDEMEATKPWVLFDRLVGVLQHQRKHGLFTEM